MSVYPAAFLCSSPGVTHILVEGDVVVSKKRNALKCWSRYCTWKKSLNGLVEVPYSISDYYCTVLKYSVPTTPCPHSGL